MMRKYIIGFICGAAVASSTAVVASDSLQAYLFPSQVAIYNGVTIQPVEVTGDNPVINYNNKAYIPLRTFAEAFGADVSFQPASPDNGSLNQIDLKIGSFPDYVVPYMRDPDGYFEMEKLQVSRLPGGQRTLTSGTIRINKDLSGKQIEITAMDSNGKPMGSTEFVSIADSETKPPFPGETRTFATRLVFDGQRHIFTYNIKVRDKLEPYKPEMRDIHLDGGVVAALYPPSGFNGHLPADQISPFTVSFQNNTGHDIVLDPYEWTFKVESVGEDDQPLSPVYEQTLPVVHGPLQAGYRYTFTVPWNPVDAAGQPVPHGRYKVTLDRPDNVTYSNGGERQVTEPLLINTRTPYVFIFDLE
ncbi:stalk domain-containing protein [Paenibacillus sp. GYB004]|uniref:stalk domain-containing protein n=1 Tax=Paenibacillus sp. GYB004 TaxID=2994393 RepID=UPI002F965482